MHIQRDISKGILHANQGIYVSKAVQKWNLTQSKPKSLPMPCKTNIDAVATMKSLVPTLAWITHTRPDIHFGVHILSRCIHKATVPIVAIALDLLCYLKAQPDLGVTYYSLQRL